MGTAIAEVCAEFRAGVVLSHTRGRPEEWRAQPQLESDALLATVREGLAASLAPRERAGIPLDAIVLDPGYGFGKHFGENYTLLARQAELLALGRPLLAGLSRKSFLGHTLAPLFGGEAAPMAEPRERESCCDDRRDSPRCVDCARARGAARSRSRAHRRRNSRSRVNSPRTTR